MNPKPGSFGLSIISGKTGKLVKIGQDIVDGRKENFTHAWFVLDSNQILEAEPGGAEINSLSKYTSLPADHVLFCDKPVEDAVKMFRLSSGLPEADVRRYEAALRYQLVSFARTLGPNGAFGEKGVPYNYLDYLAIGLEHFRIDLPFIRNRVRREDRMICSQVVDFVYSKNGIRLFTDGRLPQDVTPGDLETYAVA